MLLNALRRNIAWSDSLHEVHLFAGVAVDIVKCKLVWMYSAFYDVDEERDTSTFHFFHFMGGVCVVCGVCVAHVVVCKTTRQRDNTTTHSGLELKMIRILESIPTVQKDASQRKTEDITNFKV